MRSIRQMRSTPGQSRSRRAGGLRTAMRRVSIRPCAFSTVSARSRPDGSWRRLVRPGTAAAREGGIVAKGVNEFGLQVRLIAFDEQEVIGRRGPDASAGVGDGGVLDGRCGRGKGLVVHQHEGLGSRAAELLAEVAAGHRIRGRLADRRVPQAPGDAQVVGHHFPHHAAGRVVDRDEVGRRIGLAAGRFGQRGRPTASSAPCASPSPSRRPRRGSRVAWECT